MVDLSKQQYNEEEVDRIIRRALKIKKIGTTSHQDLVGIAHEIGLDPHVIEAAIKEDRKEQEKERIWKKRLRKRKAGFTQHLYSYIIVIGALMIINVLSPGPWWFQWPALGWGIGLAFHYKSVLFPELKRIDN
jgi:hypothetical protein